MDRSNPTFIEGWNVNRAGWPLLDSNTEPYQRGWLARERLFPRAELLEMG